MSCKLLRADSALAAVPLFGQTTKTDDVSPAKWEPSSQTDSSHQREVQQLRQTIRKLEASLPEQLRQARDAGYREGESAGFTRAEESGRPVFDKLAASIVDIASLRTRLRQETEKDLVLLALAIAKRVLHREISIDPMAVQGLVRAALDKVQTRDVTEIRIYPGHEEVVRKCLAAHHASGIEVICDPALHPGDVVIATKRGDLQASMDTQLSEIERGLTDRIHK